MIGATGARQLTSYPTFGDWHEQSETFSGPAFVRGNGLAYELADRTGFVPAAFVSGDFFPTLDVASAPTPM